VRALLGDEIDVLKHHDGRQQCSCQVRDLADGDKRPAGEDQARVPGHLAEQVARRVRLPGAGRAVEQ
jgi:hypothetical protein